MTTRTDLLKASSEHWSESLATLFINDPSRAQRFVVEACGIRFDYSKHWIDDQLKATLIRTLTNCDFTEKCKAFLSGKPINQSEGRAVLHTALRANESDECKMENNSVLTDVAKARLRAYRFAEDVRSGKLRGATDKPFTDVLNIGVGGSGLGPLMVSDALKPWIDGPRSHFVSNIDGAHLHETLVKLDPETTLVLVASKTFTTQETIHNAEKVKRWFESHLKDKETMAHFAALSANTAEASKFGIDRQRTFPIWGWVGGRFSVWSSVGLSVMLSIGSERFDQFLQGARSMDKHFFDTPPEKNIPVLMALLGIWYRNGFGFETHAVLPYDQRLEYLPAYLQQMEMESNGKQVNLNGDDIDYGTAPIIWGASGTNCQHSFCQLLHQGTVVCPMDFLVAAQPVNTDVESHKLLVANCLAQSESLAFGKSKDAVYEDMLNKGLSVEEATRLAPHLTFEGNRPSSLFLYEKLTPQILGSLLAAYEHKVFTQGVFWGINSFDQWGVELGKAQCNALRPALDSGDASQFSVSTQETVKWLKSKKI